MGGSGADTASPCPAVKGYFDRLSTKCNLFSDKGNSAPFVDAWTVFLSVVGSFIGIFTLCGINYHMEVTETDLVMITGSFGAQSVLIFAAPHSPFSQPWNCIFGSFVSSFIGVSVFELFKEVINGHKTMVYVASALAVSLSIGAMLPTRSLHPPAGATALIAILGSDHIHHMGYMYVLFPAILASSVHVTLGVFFNNLSAVESRGYPTFWSPISLGGDSTAKTTAEPSIPISLHDSSVTGSSKPSISNGAPHVNVEESKMVAFDVGGAEVCTI